MGCLKRNKQDQRKPYNLNNCQGNETFKYNEKKLFLMVKYINNGLTIFKHFVLVGLYRFSYIRLSESYWGVIV